MMCCEGIEIVTGMKVMRLGFGLDLATNTTVTYFQGY
jgi:hypothetical protein